MLIKLYGDLVYALSTIRNIAKLKLDLSDCITMDDIFNPSIFHKEMRDEIISLILPDTIKEVYLDSDTSPDFRSLQTISGKNVLYIHDYALCDCPSLVSIDFPNVISIDDNAFYNCTLLKTVDFPNVTSIGNYAFFNCISLKTMNFPNVTSIGKYAFGNCFKLESINLLKIHEVEYTTIFHQCRSLKTINLFRYYIDEFMPGVCNELFD